MVPANTFETKFPRYNPFSFLRKKVNGIYGVNGLDRFNYRSMLSLPGICLLNFIRFSVAGPPLAAEQKK